MSDAVDHHRRRPSHDVHRDDVALAHRYRLSVSSPRQSSFRVVAVIYYRSSSSRDNHRDQGVDKEGNEESEERHVVGTNDEPCHIGGSLCAERAAMLQLRFVPNVVVTRIVIVTDAPHEITPGPMCREFLASSTLVPWDVPVVLGGSSCRHCGVDFVNEDSDMGKCGSAASSTSEEGAVGRRHDFVYRIETVRSLYPNPSPYVRLTSREAVDFGERFASRAGAEAEAEAETKAEAEAEGTPGRTAVDDKESSNRIVGTGGDGSDVGSDVSSLRPQSLVDAAADASLGDDRDDVHPIRYGAAVLFSDGSVSTARQVKGLEYGCTLDAVGQLAPAIRERTGGRRGGAAEAEAEAEAVVRPVMIAQADQFGIAHAPFAPGRAYLSEHGFGDCEVVVHEFHDDCDDGGGDVHPSGGSRSGPPRLVRVRADGLVPGAPKMGGGVLLREA